jgi:hypothetical protein
MSIPSEEIRRLMKLGLLGQGQERFGKVNYFGDSVIEPLGAAQKRIVTDRDARLKSRTGPKTWSEAFATLSKAGLKNWEESMERADLRKLTDFAVSWSPETDPTPGDPIAMTTALGDDFNQPLNEKFVLDPIATLEREHAEVAEQDFVNPETYVPTTDTYKESTDYDPIEGRLIEEGFPRPRREPRREVHSLSEADFDIPPGPQMADVLLADSAQQPPETWYDAIGALDLRTAAGDVARQQAMLSRRGQEDAAAQAAAALEAERQFELEKLGAPDLKNDYRLDANGNWVLTQKGINREEEQWRDRLQPAIDNLEEINRKIRILNRALDQGNGTADIAAVNAYQRMIDDGVVRGEDVKMQASAQSLYGKLATFVNNYKKGDVLHPDTRLNMRAMADTLANSTKSNIKTIVNAWKGVVMETPGLSWDRVFPGELDTFFEETGSPSEEIDLTAVPEGVDPEAWARWTDAVKLDYLNLPNE